MYITYRKKTFEECLLNSSFLKHEFQFRLILNSASRISYRQRWTPMCQACMPNELVTQIGSYHPLGISVSFMLGLLFSLEKRIFLTLS